MKSIPNDPSASDDLEKMARRLESTGHYRVQRRLDLPSCLVSDAGPSRRGMFLDLESTGLDIKTSEPIELAILPFDYTLEGTVVAVHPSLHVLNEPSEAISTQITAITGITNELVEGRRIDPAFVTSFVEGASLIIAHNAAFDRPIAERIAPVFASKPWACSMSDVPWHDEGFQSRRLADLLAHYGLFFNSHRATDDCEAGVALLTMRLPKSNDRVLEVLLRSARTPTWRIFAVDSPFDRREKLKRRSYRWNSNSDFGPKSWWIDVVGERVDDELAYLEREVFGRAVRLPIFEITAYQRYSARSR